MTELRQWFRIAWAALTSGSNQAFYDRISPIYDQVYVEHAVHADTMVRLLDELYRDRQRETLVLDLGCGTGLLSKLLLQHGFRVIGIDLSLRSLGILQQTEPRIPVLQTDAAQLPIADGALQGVVCLGVWRHFVDQQLVLDEIRRVLDREGTLILGYFPPALGGALHVGSGWFGALLSRLYRPFTRWLGYSDRADPALEAEAFAGAGARFAEVTTIPSGRHWRLILARQPVRPEPAQ